MIDLIPNHCTNVSGVTPPTHRTPQPPNHKQPQATNQPKTTVTDLVQQGKPDGYQLSSIQ